MSTPRHTPGPWKAKKLKYNCGVVALDMERFKVRTICNVPNICTNCKEPDGYNAMLIAAAPEMYDLLAKRAEEGDAEAKALIEQIDSEINILEN